MNKIIITTTDQVEGHPIQEYKGIISFRAWTPSNRIFVGGAKADDLKKYQEFWKMAENGLREEAKAAGANAVVGVRAFPPAGSLAAVIILTGTAVVIE